MRAASCCSISGSAAADDDVDHGHHLAGDMSADVAQQAVAHAEAFEMGIVAGVGAFMKSYGHACFFELGPERLPVNTEPRLPGQRRGAQECADKSQLFAGAFRFAHGNGNIVGWQQGGAKEPLRILLAEVIEPIVISAADRFG